MDKPEPGLHFKLMALAFKIWDFFAPRMSILKEVGIKPGLSVLDYGCGSGSYITAAAGLVRESKVQSTTNSQYGSPAHIFFLRVIADLRSIACTVPARWHSQMVSGEHKPASTSE